MIELKNEKIAIPIVLLAGTIWSFGPLVVRYMDNPHLSSLAVYFWKRSNNFYITKPIFVF